MEPKSAIQSMSNPMPNMMSVQSMGNAMPNMMPAAVVSAANASPVYELASANKKSSAMKVANAEAANCGRFGGMSLAMILVLFILLVIILRAFL